VSCIRACTYRVWALDERIRVFLASPSDLPEHRALAREVAAHVDRFNADPLGFRLELVGWEDVRPGYGRPQDLINPAVDGCDVFVGVLGKRWGRPTGAASSGFAEEYGRVVKRIEEGERVGVWIYLLDLTEEDREDIGPQMQQVLEFRRRLYSSALIRTFRDEEHFARLLQGDLTDYVVEEFSARRARESLETPEGSPPPEPQSDGFVGTASDEASVQASDVLRAAVAAGPPGSLTDSTFAEFEIARLHLLAATWSSTTRTGELLGVHEINALYQHRARLQLQSEEAKLIVRTMCGHAPVAPGWGVVGSTDAVAELLGRALGDSRSAVRAGAVKMLDVEPLAEWAAETGIEGGLSEVLATLWASNDDREVLEQLSLMVSRSEREEALVALRDAATPDRLGASDAVPVLVRALLQRGEYDEAVSVADEHLSFIDKPTEHSLRKASDAADTEALLAALTATRAGIRSIAASALFKRGALAEDSARQLLNDSAIEPRVIGFEALCAQGAGVDEDLLKQKIEEKVGNRTLFSPNWVRRAKRALLRTLPADDLEATINWIWIQTGDEYAVLAEQHFERFRTQIRRDLSDDFRTFRQASLDRLEDAIKRDLSERVRAEIPRGQQPDPQAEAMLDVAASEAAHKQVEDLVSKERFNREVFAVAALGGIALHGSPEDARLVRGWTEDADYGIQEAAFLALATVGGTEDAHRLVDGAAAMHGDPQARVAEAALRLDSGDGEVARRLLEIPSSELATMAAWYLAEHAHEINAETLWEMLNHGVDEVRRAGVACAVARMSEDGLASLLEDYLEQSRLFYNVVWLLDRLLHAPEWLKRRTRGELVKPGE
jgi:uncharacterized protein DUF4062